MYQVPLEVYEELEGATPEGKRDIVLRLIEEHPDHRLELPERDGVRANLTQVDLSRVALQELVERRGGATPPWWDAGRQRADLIDADLQGAELYFANLQRAILTGANLQGAHLEYANLQGARLWHARLRGANLQGARLQGADLSGSDISHCYLSGAWLDRTRLRRELLGGAVGEELDRHYGAAKVAYLGLKGNFDELGDYAGASWAYCRERRMEKRGALEQGRYLKWLGDQIVELVCDYGEGVWRVLVCLALLWLGFALFYSITGHVLADRGAVYSTTRNPFDLLSFSLATMVTLEVPGLRPFASLAMRILMPLQAALGIILLGLLGFVAGNRIRRS